MTNKGNKFLSMLSNETFAESGKLLYMFDFARLAMAAGRIAIAGCQLTSKVMESLMLAMNWSLI